MTQGGPIEELDLLAYADGLLDPARQEEVEAHLRRDAAAAARAADYLAQNHAIRAAYGSVVCEPIPTRLLGVLERPSRPSFWRMPLRITGFATSLAAAGLLGWMMNDSSGEMAQPSDALVEASLALHSDWSPRPESAAGQVDAPLLLPKAFAAETEGEVGLRIPPPDLSGMGLRLLALRPTDGKGLPGVQLIYGDGQGERLSLFLMSALGTPMPDVLRLASPQGELAFWREGPVAFAMTGGEGISAEGVVSRVRSAMQGAPLMVFPAGGSGGGMASAPAQESETMPLLDLPPATRSGGAEAM